jgi:hypothetical protein
LAPRVSQSRGAAERRSSRFPPCRAKMARFGNRPRRLATAARRWLVARDRSPTWFGTCSEGLLWAPAARVICLAQDVIYSSLDMTLAPAGAPTPCTFPRTHGPEDVHGFLLDLKNTAPAEG